IAPGLRRLVSDLSEPVQLPPEQARRYLWNSVREFLERAAPIRPLLLVVEDLHWADDSTLLLTEYLAPHLPEMPVLLVATYRETEVGVSHPLLRIVNQLLRRHLTSRIALTRLSEEGVSAIVSGLAGQQPPKGLVSAIYGETDGNPFFVEEVFLHLAESGVLLDEQGRVRSDLQIDETDVPESVRLVLEGRLERLSPTAREGLVAAAVVGRSFEPGLVARVTDHPENLEDALDEAESARLIAPSNDNSRLRFVHELVRQTLLAGTSSIRRQRLHARTAEVIEQMYPDDLEAHAVDLAHHLSRSGPDADPARLLRYLVMAGERAVQAAAFEDAVAHFEHAITLIPDSDNYTRAEVLERLAMARRSVGLWNQALLAMDEALQLYEHLGRTEAIGRLCWAMVYQLAWAARYEDATRLATRGLAALGDVTNPDRARLLSAAAWVVGLSDDYHTATSMFQQARGLVEELGDERALADVLHMETIHHFEYAELAEGVQTGLRAAEVFEAEGALWDLCSVLAFVHIRRGRWDVRSRRPRCPSAFSRWPSASGTSAPHSSSSPTKSALEGSWQEIWRPLR
ncbi:MAG: hypothetical protein M3252_04500, partial [Actinomycetota bacterium]|nr:hypothetical protein [Actinomycetota bacterium]